VPDLKEIITRGEVSGALRIAAAQVRRNLPQFTYKCQNHSSINNFYPPCENEQWTCGFWPGEIWLAYEYSGDEIFKYAGFIQVESFLKRIENKTAVAHHDMGFLYSPSCVAAYKLTGNEAARRAALLAADQLIARFQPVGEFIQAWGELGAKDNYRYIIDCLMNLPLLFWASEESGDEKYREIALRHADTCLKYSIRPDGSTFHTVFMNPETGAFSRGETCQGYSDDSFWARGQAWAIYGAALCCRYTGDCKYIEIFKRVLSFFKERLPEDFVPYWDMIFTDGSGEPRDSSSAAIVICALLEMEKLSQYDDSTGLNEYASLAKAMLKSLVDNYSVKDPAKSNGLLLHGTYSKKSPYNTCTPEGVDECVSWGDYFYMEALMRLEFDCDWEPCW
jgi:unsaturated chondroitin disaccharide hydrolase